MAAGTSIIGGISVEAILEDTKFKSGIESMLGNMGRAETKGLDVNQVLSSTSNIIGDIGLGFLTSATAMGSFFTAAFVNSPQFKTAMGELSTSWFDLSNFLGEEFQPTIDAVVSGIESAVNFLTTDAGVKNIFDSVNSSLSSLISVFTTDLPNAYNSLPEDVKKVIKSVVQGTALALTGSPNKALETTTSTGVGVGSDIANQLTGDTSGSRWSYSDAFNKKQTGGTYMFGQNEAGVGYDMMSALMLLTNPITGAAMYSIPVIGQAGTNAGTQGREMAKGFIDYVKQYWR